MANACVDECFFFGALGCGNEFLRIAGNAIGIDALTQDNYLT